MLSQEKSHLGKAYGPSIKLLPGQVVLNGRVVDYAYHEGMSTSVLERMVNFNSPDLENPADPDQMLPVDPLIGKYERQMFNYGTAFQPRPGDFSLCWGYNIHLDEIDYYDPNNYEAGIEGNMTDLTPAFISTRDAL